MAVLVTFWLTAGLYGAASLAYTAFLFGLSSRAARTLMAVAFAAHFVAVGARGVAGRHPVSSVGDAVGFGAFILVGSFLWVAWRARSRATQHAVTPREATLPPLIGGPAPSLDAVGAFVAPFALVLTLVAYLTPDRSPELGLGILGRVHIALATLGVAAFALATCLAVLYLLQDHQLKQKQAGKVVKRGAALATLDRYMHRAVQLGFPLFSIAMVAGAVWLGQRAGGVRIEYVVAAVAWAAFAALLIARGAAGWRGKRAAWLTISGFAATLIVVAFYLVRHVLEG